MNNTRSCSKLEAHVLGRFEHGDSGLGPLQQSAHLSLVAATAGGRTTTHGPAPLVASKEPQ